MVKFGNWGNSKVIITVLLSLGVASLSCHGQRIQHEIVPPTRSYSLDEIECDYWLHPQHEADFHETILNLQPKSCPPEAQFVYDPAYLTILANLDAASYHRKRLEWRKHPLPGASLTEKERYYEKDVPFWIRGDLEDTDTLFIIFGPSFSTWQDDGWTRKTDQILKQTHPNASVLSMPGLLSPSQVLKANPKFPELTGELAARDIYARLRYALRHSKTCPDNIGLIGYSGGGGLALSLVAADEKYSAKYGCRKLFGMGALAFSPIIDPLSTFCVLDQGREWALEQDPSEKAYTKPITSAIETILIHGLPRNVKGYAKTLQDTEKNAKRRARWQSKFYHEFRRVDLLQVAKANYTEAPKYKVKGSDSHVSYYRDEVFPHHSEEAGGKSLEEYTKISSILAPVQESPIYIIFPLDDPVLCRPQLTDPAKTSVRTLQSIKWLNQKSNIRVFAPERGAHLAYFLNTDFVTKTIDTFF